MNSVLKRTILGLTALHLLAQLPQQDFLSRRVLATDIPAKTFAASPEFSTPQLSPNGAKLAYLSADGEERVLMVQSLTNGETYAIPPQFKSEIRSFEWANDDVILLTLSMTRNRHGSRPVYQTRVIAYTLGTQKARWLAEPQDDKRRNFYRLPARASQFENIVDILPNEPDHILLDLDLELDGISEVYKATLSTGQLKIFKPGNEGVQNWYTDTTSSLRLGTGYRGAGKYDDKRYAILKTPDGNWTELEDLDWFEKHHIQGFSVDPNVAYVSGPAPHGRTGLFALSLTTGEIGASLFGGADREVLGIITDRESRALVGVRYFDGQIKHQYFDASLAGLQQSMRQAAPGANVYVVDWLKSQGKYVILVANSTNPGSYYLFDATSGKLSALANSRTGIDPARMASSKITTVSMRDGARIDAVLTIPAGRTTEAIPFVVLPHGGPRTFDTASWDYWAQFYANRGYGVLQPNFRGSAGYGEAFGDAGNLQWGGRMQQDITDASKWLIREGLAAKGRICIVGASFGGYAALMGAIQEPALYACAVSVNGVTDLPDMKSFDKNFIGGDVWIQNMGLAGAKDKDVSPYHLADQIRTPVLLIAAKDDTRVPVRQSENMHSRLRKLKKDSRFVELKDGGHSLITMKSRLTMLKETERFLKKHLGK